ncbi:MAG: S1 RNA-binding domain-containing protein [Planctomycetota bacterium]
MDVNFIKDISIFLNEKVTVEVMQLDKRRGRMVVSRRKVVARDREQRQKELTKTLQVGNKITAVINSIQAYGAFADIGGMDGLIHVSDLSYQRVNHPKDVVKEGDQVEVQILKLELERDPPRISLGMKQCMADPFTTKMSDLTEGESVTGKVTRTTDFGAFVEIAPGVEGLVHISQLAHERVHKVEHVVKKDQEVTCQIVSLDPDSRRIGLSIKALQDAPKGMKGGREEDMSRGEDPHMRKLKAQLSAKFGENLKGGLF